ncbi:MAG: glycoside hydrolase family 65 protein [Spirochaetota bacterium]
MSDQHEPLYPVAGWNVTEDELNLDRVSADESVLALGNGYMGVRGTYEEHSIVYANGTLVNGFHEIEPIVYGEHAYGYAENRQRMIALPDGTVIELTVNDYPLDLTTGTIRSYRRMLRMKTGLLERSMRWTVPDGTNVDISIRRLVSFRRPHVMAIEWKCTVDAPARVQIVSVIRGRGPARVARDDPRVGSALSREALLLRKRDVDERVAHIRYRTRNSGYDVITAAANVIECECDYTRDNINSQQEVGHALSLTLGSGRTTTLRKYVAVYTSLEHPRSRLTGLAKREVEMARRSGFAALHTEQKGYLDEFWTRSDVRIEGDESLQQSIRFNLFHLLQAAGRNGHTSVAAKGLTGEGYEGHYFWDTETYMLPFFTYTNPGIARALLEYRYHTLDAARRRARVLRHRGALYPWRTINGEEASAYFPAGTAQYHINADIIYAMRTYVNATGDRWFLLKRGAEMLFETARFWVDLGCYIDGKGFCINEVTGPDEYTALVNNNVYTNLMASDHLQYAARTYREMRRHDEPMLSALAERIGLDGAEADEWQRAADAIYIPHDRERGIYPQDDAFFDRDVWDFQNTPPDRYPLLLHYHPLTIYRFQVLKQPDLVMALFLQGHRFTRDEKRRNFHFYDPLTTGDSSLSACVQSIIAAEIGETELAYRYFMKTARMDLDDVNGNVKDGIHAAAMAGTWLSMVYGFAGMRDFHETLSFQPYLPREWDRLTFRVLWRGTPLEVSVGREATRYSLPRGGEVAFIHAGLHLTLTDDESIELRNPSDEEIRSGVGESTVARK